ncbi:MAG: hypothetical protein ACREX8_14550, partial [Gammaproteobacteria bacterium]
GKAMPAPRGRPPERCGRPALLERLGRPRMSRSGLAAVVVTGSPVEVALARQATDAAMRRTWRDRQQGRATPLLVVHDAIGKPGLVRVDV